MKRILSKLIGTTAIIFVLCLTGLVLSGEAQAQRFVDNGDGTVSDTQTGMLWTKNANPFGKLDWHDAMARCGSFSISGIGGWRLPSKDELVVLYHAIQGGHPFTGVQSGVHSFPYWSSTNYADGTVYAWDVYMNGGNAHTSIKGRGNHVWCTRAGQ